MNRACPDRGDLRRFDELGPVARVEIARHAQGCARCRSVLVSRDPSRVFALLAATSVLPGLLDRVSGGVAAAIAREAGRSGPAVSASRRAAAVGWAAAVLLAVSAGTMLLGPRQSTPARAPHIAAGDSRSPDGSRDERVSSIVEVLSSPGTARVVDLRVGETQVVMVFDERIAL